MSTLKRNRLRYNFLVLLVFGLVMAMSSGLAWSYSSGPPNGRTDAPGEGNCTACHSSFPLNSGSGFLSVSDFDGEYEPGQSYDLIVSLEDPDASRWGFELTIIGQDDQEIGTLTSLDSHTQIAASGGRTYAKQTSTGTQNGAADFVVWNVRWTAPAAGEGDAFIYLAGNAANGNFSTSGDRIYTTEGSWSEEEVSAVPASPLASAQLMPNYPNPFNPRTTIVYELAQDQTVRLAIYSMDGRLVRQLENGIRNQGHHEVMWDGLDSRGMGVSSGTYFYRLQTGNIDQKRSMVLVR